MARRRLRNTVFTLLLAAYVVTAIKKQLNQAPQGSFAGIRYDFRLPTLQKLRDTFWNKDTSQVVMPPAFGIGWALNLYPLLRSKLYKP
jgi:hypothetical protein